MQLPAAGLLVREHHVVPEPLQHGDGRPRRFREERVAQTRDEEPDAHSRIHRAELLDDSQLETQQVANLTQTRNLVPDSESDMMCGALGAPSVEKRGWCRREADPRVRVSDSERWPRDRFALSRNQLQASIGGLCDTEDRHRPQANLHLDRKAGARFTVIELESARDGSAFG